MPIEQSDNTRVAHTPIILPEKVDMPYNLALLWDADKTKRYANLLKFYNNNFFGYGVTGNQTNYDPRTSQGLTAIRSNFNYAKDNVLNFAENILTSGIAEGVGQAIKWAITPTKIGSGAEAIVSSAPISPQVTKVSIIPRSEMHLRNGIPGALKSTYVGTSNGLHTYTQPKVSILSKEQLSKASKRLEKYMISKGWRKVTHPNLQGLGFTNGRHVISDLGPGNVGRDWLGRLRLVDFAIETAPEFKMAMQKKGGKLKQ